jgi:3-oxoacid CoA-transferase subunit A
MTGDIHGDPWRFWSIENFCNNHKTTTDDWLICLGDVGLNYYGAKSKEEISLKNEAAKLPIKMFCIHGNHERRPIKEDGYKEIEVTEGAIQGPMLWDSRYPNQYFAIDGAVYKIQTSERTLNALVCGGAYSVDKFYRLQFRANWWPDEQPNELTKGLVRLMATRYPIDIMLTHTCPLRFEPKELFLDCIDQSTVDTSTEEFFDDLYEQFPANKKPMWYFGHFHGDKYTDDYVMLFNDIIELK